MKDEDHVSHNIEAENNILENVEKYGFHIALLSEDGYLPSFAYTIGLFKNYNHPEIIIFGLNIELMGRLLNEVGNVIKNGNSITLNKNYSDYLNDYPIQFLKVKREHYPDYLGYCGWFYKNSFDFPTYQMVWPDKKGLYPWEENFNKNWKFKQKLLDRDINFKFYEEKNLGVYTTKEVLSGSPILYVYHDEDGSWQFHSQENHKILKAKLVCLEELIKLDSSLNEIHYINYGQSASRINKDAKWEIGD